MMFPRRVLLIIGSIAVCMMFGKAQQPVADHPLISRFAGSEVNEYDLKEFDEYPLVLGPYQKGKFQKVERLEGKVTHFHYTNPPNRSSLEIFRNYLSALQRAGFKILFMCNDRECGEGTNNNDLGKSIGWWCIDWDCGEPMRYVAAKLSRQSGDVYVAIKVRSNGVNETEGTFLNVIEVKPMEGGLVTVNAAELAGDIAQTGHAAVYGIYFDSGKAVVKPESDPTLAEISKLLASDSQLKLHVIGHTDNVGTLASNMALSKQRADAVVAALVTRYDVAPGRLQAAGVGPLAPVATNRNENGRGKNRRVELVEQ